MCSFDRTFWLIISIYGQTYGVFGQILFVTDQYNICLRMQVSTIDDFAIMVKAGLDSPKV